MLRHAVPAERILQRCYELTVIGARSVGGASVLDRRAHRVDQRAQRRGCSGGGALESQQPSAEPGRARGDEDKLMAGPLRHGDLANESGDDIERETLVAGNGTRAELDYLSGHNALFCVAVKARCMLCAKDNWPAGLALMIIKKATTEVVASRSPIRWRSGP